MTVAVEFQHPSDNLERANVGLEYALNEHVLRAWRLPHQLRHRRRLAFGFGAALHTGEKSKLQADYSAVDMSALGYVHRFTLSVTY